MTTRRPVKERPPRRNRMKAGRPLLVGVIASPADLQFAARMTEPPDLFEIRLDYFCKMLTQLERKIDNLRAPIILTARDPREGGTGSLSIEKRRQLLWRFLPHAKYVDVELRSARALKPLLAEARKRKLRVIFSFHDFKSTPSSRSLRAKAARAKRLGADIFKVATRADHPSELGRLVDFIANNNAKIDISAMGMGKLGGLSRLLLARCGSVLNYASLEQSVVEGQPSVDVLRSAIPR